MYASCKINDPNFQIAQSYQIESSLLIIVQTWQSIDHSSSSSLWLETFLRYSRSSALPAHTCFSFRFSLNLKFSFSFIGNSLVYGIYVVEISAYMLKYQHC